MKTQLVLCLALVAGCALAKFTPGSNFCDDEKERHNTCKPLVNQEGCDCSNSKDSSSSSKSKGGSSEEGSKGSNESSGSNEGSGSGSGSGSGCQNSWENSGSGSGSGSSDESSGTDVSSGTSSGVESGEWEDGEYCFLLQIFWKFSLTLDLEFQLIFQQWINVTQATIVSNVELTEYQILVELYYSLQILFEKHVEIKYAIEFEYIGEWGYVFELEGLCHDIQTINTEITIEEVITIVGGTCPLFESLIECGENATSTEQAAIQVLIQKLTVIISGSYTFSQKLTLIYQEFSAFFIQYPDLKVLIFSGKIELYGSIQSYFDICLVYWRIENFSLAVGGSVSECSLIQVLIELYSDTSYSVSQRSSFKELEVKIENYFSIEVDVQLRIQYFSEQLYQYYILESWSVKAIYSLEIEGYGSVYQLIYAYIYCQNHNVTFPPKTTTSTSTSTSTSTTTTTTKPTTTTTKPTTTTTKPTTTTTKPTTTTTKPNGNCGTVTKVNTFSANITLLLTAIQTSQNSGTWTSTQISQFAGYKLRIYNLSKSQTSSNVTATFTAIKTVLTGFTTNVTFKQMVHAIFIQTWGTIGQYCGCSL